MAKNGDGRLSSGDRVVLQSGKTTSRCLAPLASEVSGIDAARVREEGTVVVELRRGPV